MLDFSGAGHPATDKGENLPSLSFPRLWSLASTFSISSCQSPNQLLLYIAKAMPQSWTTAQT